MKHAMELVHYGIGNVLTGFMIVYLILPYVMGMVFVKMVVMKKIVPKIVLEKVWNHTLNMME